MDLFSQIENPEREEILALRKELEQANHQYYVLNAPTMSDYDFDQKLHRLQYLEARYPDMFDASSPTQRVGSDIEEIKGERQKARRGKDLSRWLISIQCCHYRIPIRKRK